ncbi:hypothetical protein [Tenacibaculum ovolyticum]|uniref:hypothetical protein n=1 Tax=Tenacibaculum ovolyticum TaxID=104270 RepID=UPI00040D3AD3|nr:hypothetical protein [Tenacibaculum ovolyticum]
MKYVIITLVITAILVILGYILDLTNNKSDKYFILFIGSVLILSGLFFSIRSEVVKSEEEAGKIVKIDDTLENTEKIKLKADSLIANLNESLEKTLTLSKNINKQNEILSNVEKDMEVQNIALKNTLKQTKLFEEKVKEQLKIEKKRFDSEKPNVDVSLSYSVYNNIKHYRLLYDFRNQGKREAKNLKISSIILFVENRMVNKHIILENSGHENLEVPASKKRRLLVYSQEKFSFNEIDAMFSEALVKIKYSYRDDYSNKKIIEEKTFAWLGKKESGLVFHYANKEWSTTIDDYIKVNNLDF